MKLILPLILVILLIGLYFIIPEQEQAATEQTEAGPEIAALDQVQSKPDSVAFEAPQAQPKTGTASTLPAPPESLEDEQDTAEPPISEPTVAEEALQFNLDQSTHFLILGNADNEQGKLNFKSELLPSNEVKLALELEQQGSENIQLTAYFDLANFTMELDGGNRILNEEHKALLKATGEQLQSAIWAQYADYDIPEHALMLAQMLAYWSVSPKGFVHEKRVIVSQ